MDRHPSMLSLSSAIAVGALMLTACTPESAGWSRPEQPVATPAGLLDASDPQLISEIAARYGSAYWERDGFRDPRIRAEASGVDYVIEFYGCEEGRACRDLRLVAHFPPDPEGESATRLSAEEVADWNQQTRFGKVTIDEDEVVVLEMNLTLIGGVTRQNFDQSLDWWVIALSGLVDTFDLVPERAELTANSASGKKSKNRP